MEVIDPATWTYVAVTRSWQFPGNKLGISSTINFPAFNMSAKPVYYRIALMGTYFPFAAMFPALATDPKQILDVDNMTFTAN